MMLAGASPVFPDMGFAPIGIHPVGAIVPTDPFFFKYSPALNTSLFFNSPLTIKLPFAVHHILFGLE